MAPRVSVVLLALLFVAFPAVSAAAAPTPASGGPAAQSIQTTEPARENTTLHVQLQQNGNANWTVTTTVPIDDDSERRAFERTGEAYLDGDSDRNLEPTFRAASDGATAVSGREMGIENVSRDYVIEDGRGHLVLSFTWTNFGVVNGTRLVVQDAFYTPDGTWLNTLDENQTLVVSPPAGYALTNSPQDAYLENGKLRLEGDDTDRFTRSELAIVYEGDPRGTASPTPGLGGGVPLVPVAGLLALVGLAAVLYYLNDSDEFPAVGASSTSSSGGSDGPAAPETANGGSEPNEEIDVELLSDEERVERLLDQNGGRMKQARIVKETGWSNAKVSQLLSSMDEEDRIDKLRIGRENLISFPDEDVTEIED